MRSFTTRLIIFVSSILIAFIVAMQVHWLNKTYAYEKNEFNTSVLKAIRGVYEDIPLLYSPATSLDSVVEPIKNNTFLFQLDSMPAKDSLISKLSAELETFHVFTDCKVALYDHQAGKYIFQSYISADGSDKNQDTLSRLPLIVKPYNFVHLYFPNRDKYIIREMNSWIYASAALLLLLVGFSFSIYYFLKQKFLVEIQKDFINNVTHEFSTPLSVIDLSVEGLEKSSTPSSPEKYKRYVDSIKYQSDYLKGHISNLVKTVVAGHYHLLLIRKPVIVNELLKKAVLQLQAALEKRNGTMRWKLEEENIVIPGDEENLYLAFFNILNNAIKYSTVPEITVVTGKKGNKYYIKIRDNGVGIEASEQRKIFKKFYRSANGNIHNAKGLGLGLYFTKKVIDGHKGIIKLNSIPGIGTEFIIELPFKN